MKISPPYVLVEYEEIPIFDGYDNSDLIIYIKKLQSQRKKDIVDKTAIRNWFDTLQENILE